MKNRKHGNYIKKDKPSELNQPSNRICLKCEQVFGSEGPWNRLCPACKNKETNISKRLSTSSPIKFNPRKKGIDL